MDGLSPRGAGNLPSGAGSASAALEESGRQRASSTEAPTVATATCADTWRVTADGVAVAGGDKHETPGCRSAVAAVSQDLSRIRELTACSPAALGAKLLLEQGLTNTGAPCTCKEEAEEESHKRAEHPCPPILCDIGATDLVDSTGDTTRSGVLYVVGGDAKGIGCRNVGNGEASGAEDLCIGE